MTSPTGNVTYIGRLAENGTREVVKDAGLPFGTVKLPPRESPYLPVRGLHGWGDMPGCAATALTILTDVFWDEEAYRLLLHFSYFVVKEFGAEGFKITSEEVEEFRTRFENGIMRSQ